MNKNLKIAALALAGVTMIGLTGCSNTDPVKAGSKTDSNSSASKDSGLSGSLAGAGASSQEAAMGAWRADFQKENPNFTVTYDAVGSGAGIEQFLSKQVSFAGSDEAMQPDELEKSKEVCGGESAFDIPVYISPIAVVFNLEGVDTINLSAAQIAKIFKGEITKWNDPDIAAANPNVKLPDLAITPVHRADKSGTTENFTAYLAGAASEVWTDKPSKEWPIPGGESADKTSGMVQTVSAGQGTIGYADASQAGSLGTVALKVGDSYTKFSPEAAGKAVADAKVEEGRAEGDLGLALDRKTTTAGVYPLVLVSYLIACPSYADAATADSVKAFFDYVVSKEGQASAASAAGSAPLPDEMSEKAKQSISKITAK